MQLSVPYKIDATMISCYMRCREDFRRRYVEGIIPVKEPMHMCFGSVMHAGIESFWLGRGYAEAMKDSIERALQVDQSGWNPKEKQRWEELVNSIPDLLTIYFEAVEWKPPLAIEREFPKQGEENLVRLGDALLCGKFDRIMLHEGRITDWEPKTASEINPSEWKRNFRNQWIRSWQFGLYDWALQRLYPTDTVTPPVVEAILKPYKAKPGRYEAFPLPEIAAHRNSFEIKLDMVCREMVHFLENWRDAKPWPQSDSACIGKYGPCDYIELCTLGENPKLLKQFKSRSEHLEIMK